MSLCFLKLILGSHGLLPYEANRDHTLFKLVVMMSDTTSEVLQTRPYAFSCWDAYICCSPSAGFANLFGLLVRMVHQRCI